MHPNRLGDPSHFKWALSTTLKLTLQQPPTTRQSEVEKSLVERWTVSCGILNPVTIVHWLSFTFGYLMYYVDE